MNDLKYLYIKGMDYYYQFQIFYAFSHKLKLYKFNYSLNVGFRFIIKKS